MLKITIDRLQGEELKTPIEITCLINIALDKEVKGGIIAGVQQFKDVKKPSSDFLDLKRGAFKYDSCILEGAGKSVNLGLSLVETIEKRVKQDIEALKIPSIVKIELV